MRILFYVLSRLWLFLFIFLNVSPHSKNLQNHHSNIHQLFIKFTAKVRFILLIFVHVYWAFYFLTINNKINELSN